MVEDNGIGVCRKRPGNAKKARPPVEDPRLAKEVDIQKNGVGTPKSGQKIQVTEEALFKDWDNEDDEWWNGV